MIESGPLRIGQLADHAARPERPAEVTAARTGAAGAASPAALAALFEAAAGVAQGGRAVAEAIRTEGVPSAGQLGVLRVLDRRGPQTMPQMARARMVSRQHIQSLVNRLVEKGHVEFIANPAHKRSKLVRLTTRGKALADAMGEREARVLRALEVEIPDRDLRAATRALQAVREALGSERGRGRAGAGRPESSSLP